VLLKDNVRKKLRKDESKRILILVIGFDEKMVMNLSCYSRLYVKY